MTPAAALHLLEQAERTHKRAHWRLAARALGAIVANVPFDGGTIATEHASAPENVPSMEGHARPTVLAAPRPQAGPVWRPEPREQRGPVLCEYLASRGLRDDGGELSGRDFDRWHRGKPFRRRLVRPDGLPLERAAQAAFEAGLFPDLIWEQFEPRGVEIMLAAMEREFGADFPALASGGGSGDYPEGYDPELDGVLQ